MTVANERALPLARRLWIYQAERFPLAKHGPAIAVFAAAGVGLSAHLGGRPWPGMGTFLVAAAVALLLFLQLRLADEFKDAEEDRRWRPHRPVPRGLVGLGTLGAGALVAALLQAGLAAALAPVLLAVLAAVWLWMALMTVEFGVADWLRRRPVLYLVSHMAVMPLIALFVTACEWLPAGGDPSALWPFLVLAFANGCVLEIGRKVWAPVQERIGVETYSALWGPRPAAAVWLSTVVGAALTLVVTGAVAGALWAAVAVAVALAMPAVLAWRRFHRRLDARAQRGVEAVSGLWLLGSYLALLAAPLVGDGATP